VTTAGAGEELVRRVAEAKKRTADVQKAMSVMDIQYLVGDRSFGFIPRRLSNSAT
jgi:hypothetical protein